MKRVIYSNSSNGPSMRYQYGDNYFIYLGASGWKVEDEHGHALSNDSFSTDKEAEEYVDSLSVSDTDTDTTKLTHSSTTVKLPKSFMYKKLKEGKISLQGIREAYVLQYGNYFYSRKGLVKYKDDAMVVFLDKDSANNTIAHTPTSYKLATKLVTKAGDIQ